MPGLQCPGWNNHEGFLLKRRFMGEHQNWIDARPDGPIQHRREQPILYMLNAAMQLILSARALASLCASTDTHAQALQNTPPWQRYEHVSNAWACHAIGTEALPTAKEGMANTQDVYSILNNACGVCVMSDGRFQGHCRLPKRLRIWSTARTVPTE